MRRDNLVQFREEDSILTRLVWSVHAGEGSEIAGETFAILFCFQGGGCCQHALGYAATGLVLRVQRVDQFDQLTGLAESRKQVILFELLVVILDEFADDSGGIRNRLYW